MNKSEIVKAVARQTNIEAPVVDEVLASILKLVVLNLAVGEAVMMRGFGRFECRDRPPTTLRNPRTGEPIPVPARTTVVFLPSALLKGRVNGDAA